MFLIRRLKNSLKSEGLRKISDGLFTSKLRYGLQPLSQIRWRDDDVQTNGMEQLQKSQNKLLRLLNYSKISDKISIKSMLEKHNMLSVNQINAQIKLTEMWKAMNDIDHPFKIEKQEVNESQRMSRSVTNGVIKCIASSGLTQSTFINDGVKAWNKAPMILKNCQTISAAKTEIKKWVKTLPI